ncbi:MAG: hypothetical protein LC620_01095, partial [Halobacteriales archaeon]|nr:hypothetical protein [Halobacteriales archaeon]
MQRSWPLALAAIFTFNCIALAAHGADIPAPPAGPLAEDAAADVKANDAVLPSQLYPSLDLLALSVAEDADTFHFTVKVTDVKTGQDAASDDGQAVYVQFDHGGRSFLVSMFHFFIGSEYNQLALSYRDGETSDWSMMWFHAGALKSDAAAETFVADIPRGDLADAQGTAPFPGRVLSNFKVFDRDLAADSNFICIICGQNGSTPARVHDEMPDTGVAPLAYPVQIGLRQTGHAFLASAEPFRASNGEATTFLFKAVGRNTGDASDRFELRATQVPKDWSVSLPVPTLQLDAGVEQEFPVLVTLPFSHVHGSVLSFVVEMTSVSDGASVGRLGMGVRFLATPQPAGHHNTLYFHSYAYTGPFSQALTPVFTGNDGYPFMNALETSDDDAGIALTPAGANTYVDGTTPYVDYSWCLRLNPGLQMGLDFLVGQTGQLSVPIHATAPLQGASLEATLYLQPADSTYRGPYACYNADQLVPLAALNSTAPADVAANGDTILQGDMVALPASDKIAYLRGQDLLLFVQVHSTSVPNFFTGADAPTLKPGGQVTLPLLEYHDAVTSVLATASGPAVTLLGAQERHANPGATMVLPFSVANTGEAARTMTLNVTGTHAEWVESPLPLHVDAHAAGDAQV